MSRTILRVSRTLKTIERLGELREAVLTIREQARPWRQAGTTSRWRDRTGETLSEATVSQCHTRFPP
jgi:hypothetical protein